MENPPRNTFSETASWAKKIPFLGYFFEKSFFHYLWVSGIFSAANIFLLWFFIDVLEIPTLVASTGVIGGTFLLRYVLFRLTKVI